MSRPSPGLEVADVFRRHGAAYRESHPMPLHHRKLMCAIENCRTSTMGGHVDKCGRCGFKRISYNSCRNRHCPKCQSSARAKWVRARRDELVPTTYYHVVFTLPVQAAEIAFQNKKAVYAILFRTAAETLLTIGRDPKHLGAELGLFAVLHTWGQNLLYHPHVHCVVPGGGLSPDGKAWVSCKPGFFLPVRVLSRLFRRLFLEALKKAFDGGRLKFHNSLAHLSEKAAFARRLDEMGKFDWVVYAKPPFGGPERVLEYLGRYTHRVALSNNRLVSMEGDRVRFRWRDYRHGNKKKVMELDAGEFIRRFLLHALPPRFPRIRHYGLMANARRKGMVERCRELLNGPRPELLPTVAGEARKVLEAANGETVRLCPKCGKGTMERVEKLAPCRWPHAVDSS